MTDNVESVELDAIVPESFYGKRLDQALAELFPDYSRSRIKDWILAGNVSVNDVNVSKPREKLVGGESVAINAQIEVHGSHQAQDIELDIVYEDDDILVINKPRDLVVHPGAGNADGTILNALLNHVPDIATVPRAGIVHRLDKDTTGLMVVAKTIPAQTHLVEQLQAREISREYEAVVYGTMVAGGMVDQPIGRHPTKRTSMAIRETGKLATTHYRVMEKFRAHTHLRLKLETGRTHQIRVHMSYLKHPLVGDPLYGGRPKLPKRAGPDMVHMLRTFNRQALHAAQLELAHPISGEWMGWQAPLPDDMVELLAVLKQDTEEHGVDWE
ncbi:23S rRNA pseudouridine(1911/1915/1917) synthase RluD [Aestuariibacter sp. AA17]|uniref:Pseudouridine synthase n=1 Tax=Fluctibacter corallii TaxID=2984329 RepID=A0ABT3A3F0_9ALTE|nr:23S rRNA pseudouridine(1911/1915/1917) synthase RluD [Aestuariibacter sp. AA17]MCV2883196.1 23S rRNA pseudouridine(1911/1915/1917) synthase RluD [Aestuariibacter sp. AA17]